MHIDTICLILVLCFIGWITIVGFLTTGLIKSSWFVWYTVIVLLFIGYIQYNGRQCYKTIVEEVECPLYTIHLPKDRVFQVVRYDGRIQFLANGIKYPPKSTVKVRKYLQESGGISFEVPEEIVTNDEENFYNIEFAFPERLP